MIERILVVRLSALGDIVQTTGAVAALARARPECRIHWCVQREFAPVLSGLPFVHHVLEHDRRGGLAAMRSTARRLRAVAADAALDLQGNWKSAWLTRASRARRRLGWVGGARRESLSALLLPERVRPIDTRRHPAALAYAVVRELAPTAVEEPPRLIASSAEVEAERRCLAELGIDPDAPFTVLIAGSRDPRDWPFAQAAIEARTAARPVVWLSGPGEPVRPAPGSVEIVHPPGSLRRLVALGAVLAAAGRDAIGPDRGPTHVLAAAGARTTALFGPQDPQRTAPPTARVLVARDRPRCAPCRRTRCHHPEGPVCMGFTTASGVLVSDFGSGPSVPGGSSPTAGRGAGGAGAVE